ncbi:MAG: hypothetical protein J6Q38_04895 [Clostridia bacterium]|nr:hypothetical protein [Clostridia bacterium]
MENSKSLQYFTLICKLKNKDKFVKLLRNYTSTTVHVISGRGSVSKSVLLTAFGLECEEKKSILSCLMKYEKANELIKILNSEYGFDKSNTGIAFSVSVEGLLF